jgi:adenosylcobyric acid synthase
MRHISIFGTSSDAGKSTMTFVIAKILQDTGLRVAPLKHKNVSNNAGFVMMAVKLRLPSRFRLKF